MAIGRSSALPCLNHTVWVDMMRKSYIANMIAGATTGYCVMKAASSIASRRRARRVTPAQNPLDERVGEIADVYTGSDYGMASWQTRDGPIK
jgi:hypothetical protein